MKNDFPINEKLILYEMLMKNCQKYHNKYFFKGRWFSFNVLSEVTTFTGCVLKPGELT